MPPARMVSPLIVALLPSTRVPSPPWRLSEPVTARVVGGGVGRVSPPARVSVPAPPRVGALWPANVPGPLTVPGTGRVTAVLARTVPPLSVADPDAPPRALLE